MNSNNIWYQGNENKSPAHYHLSYYSAIHLPTSQITQLRQQFVTKVYDCLFYQFMVTAAIVGLVYCSLPLQLWLHQNNKFVFVLSIVLTFIPPIVLLVSKYQAQTYPNNYILMGTLTIGVSLILCFILIYGSPAIVFEATVMTVIAFLSLSQYARKTTVDYSSYRSLLSSFIIALVVGGFLNIILSSSLLDFMISVVGVGVFCFYIVYDTQELVMKSTDFSEGNVVLTTMNLYLDVVYLFIRIVNLLEKLFKKKD